MVAFEEPASSTLEPGSGRSESEVPLLPESQEDRPPPSDTSLWHAAVEYRKVMLWSAFFALSALLWGYDNQVRRRPARSIGYGDTGTFYARSKQSIDR